MNIYDTKVILCINCKNAIGEVDFDAEIIRPKCGKCTNPLAEVEKIPHTIIHPQNFKGLQKENEFLEKYLMVG